MYQYTTCNASASRSIAMIESITTSDWNISQIFVQRFCWWDYSVLCSLWLELRHFQSLTISRWLLGFVIVWQSYCWLVWRVFCLIILFCYLIIICSPGLSRLQHENKALWIKDALCIFSRETAKGLSYGDRPLGWWNLSWLLMALKQWRHSLCQPQLSDR